MTPPPVDPKAAQKAVDALVKALGVPSEHLTEIQIRCGGTVKVLTRERAYYTAAHVAPFIEGEK